MVKYLTVSLALLLLCAGAFAQAEVSYSDDFQSYGTQKNPPGWVDTSVGSSKPDANGLYKTWPDPLQDNKGTNVVYGTKQSSGKPEGNNPRIGTFSTLTTKSFLGAGRFELRGRFIRTSADTRAGFTFFSSYPEKDSYYLIGTWTQPGTSKLTMQLFGFGAGTLTQTTDSNFAPDINKWIRFLIQADDSGGQTRIRARFWLDGTAEPQSFAIDAVDSSATRLKEGRIGIWSAVKGDAYVDDLAAKSPVDHAAPALSFFENGVQLQSGVVTALNHDARVEVRATDDLSGIATLTVTLDGQPYTPLTPIASEGAHTVRARAVDGVGNAVEGEARIFIDKTAPVVAITEGGRPLVSGAAFNRSVTPQIAIQDLSATTTTATLNAQPFAFGAEIAAEGSYTLAVSVSDAPGWTTNVPPIVFIIDKTAPAISITTPAANASLTAARVIVTGDAGDAVSVSVNGVGTVIGADRKFATVEALELLEGENVITATGTDRAGNSGTAAISVKLDTRAPQLTVTAPAANACISANELAITGRANDTSLVSVKVSIGGTEGDATLSADKRSFTATLPAPAEGTAVLRVEALDAAGFSSVVTVPIALDRTKPVVEITESGSPFTAAVVNRAVAPSIRARDLDPSATIVATLDGAAYASGTAIAGEGAHELRVRATDCAGLVSDEVVRRFVIDTMPPAIVSIAPANGASAATKGAIAGTLSEPASLVLDGTNVAAAVNGTQFTLAAPLSEGPNALVLLLTDAAGNQSRTNYSVTVDTTPPAVEIVVDGAPVPPDAVYAREVIAEVRAGEPRATVTTTLDGALFTSGGTISADGVHTIVARAKDALGNESAPVMASFRIDRSRPAVDITSPANGAKVTAAAIEVRGTISDSSPVAVNGIAATLAAGAFSAIVPLELGPNVITAIAIDAAGNSTVDSIEVTRDSGSTGLLVTSPMDNLLTNRPTTVVAGQVLTPSAVSGVTINGAAVAIDAAGAFRKTGFALAEGANTIVVAAGASSVTVRVTADFTPPVLRVLGNNIELADGARFAAAPAIALETSDAAAVTTKLTVDGEVVSPGVLPLLDGAHALTAIARDAAGNETRADRVFFIGSASSSGGCALSNFDPVDGTAVFADNVRITGRAGGAPGVLVNGSAAAVADGSFCADVPLAPGRNEITIRCASASGAPTNDPASTLILFRYADPAIAIDTPAAGATVNANSVTVSGTVGAGVVSGDVNGVAFTVPDDGASSHAFSVADVPLAAGLNVITARARTKSSRVAIATTRVKALVAAPQLTITSPLTGTETGATTIDVTGTYANVDPVTIAIGSQSATTTQHSATSGTFSATVAPPLGPSTITAFGRNGANVLATATTSITLTAGHPSISIIAPADNTFLASTLSGALRVSGTFLADAGAQIHVNGVAATIAGDTFSADVDLASSASGTTPVIARITMPDARGASDSIRVVRFAEPLAVRESFPANDASNVERGVSIVVLFNHLLDGSTASALRVTDAEGANVAGELFADHDAISFAPHEALRAGARYTASVVTSLKDVAGAQLAGAHSFSFTTAGSAPAAAPILDETTTTGCLSGATVTGRVTTPGARVRLDVDGVTMTTVANDTGAFQFKFTFSGQSGYHVVRVREVGADGTLSAERAVCYRVNCATPQVLAATLDRAAKTLAIQFSKPMDAAMLTASNIVVTPEGEPALAATIAVNDTTATLTFASIPAKPIALLVRKTVKDSTGASMTADYTQTFAFSDEPALERGKGYVSGAVYDATNGRPLAAARVILGPAEGEGPSITNERGRYARALAEGAYTLEASAPGYTTVWRQVVVPAGASVVPIDIRLTKRGSEQSALTLTHGGDTTITKKAELTLSSTSLPSGARIRLTSLGGQSLAGLLPLGWSPLSAAEIAIDDSSKAFPIPGAKLKFFVDANAIATAAQTVSLAQYDSDRDEWRVVAASANGATPFDITTSGNYALVYADKAPSLAAPPPARTGATLQGVANPCIPTPDVCRLTGRSFSLEPRAVLPSGRAAATLITEGAKPYPSGTAVQAFIDEQLNLADGRVLVDPPFATDLLVYRTLAGDTGVADFHLAPTLQAQSVILRDGVDHIRIVDYPGRIDRGTLLGAEGGRVPGDDSVSLDVPAGAASEPLHASVAAIPDNDLAAFGAIAGFRIAGGFTFTLTRANELQPIEGVTVALPELLTPARATMAIPAPPANAQVIVAEVLSSTSYGIVFRLVALMSPAQALEVAGTRLFTTRPIVSTQLPLDGIIRDGRYLVLVADAPVAFAFGQVRHASGATVANARVTANSLGVRDVTRNDGVFVLPVIAKPAAPFTLVARSMDTGDGAPASATTSPDPGAFVDFGALTLAAQPPSLQSMTPPNGAELDAASVVIQATFNIALDAASTGGLSLIDSDANARVAGRTELTGGSTIRFIAAQPLLPATRYAITAGPDIRAANGAPFGRSVTSNFSTRAVPQSNTAIRRERIRITLPDASGKSTISGAAGALPANARALAVRRGRLFIESYQATVAGDGAFSFDAGHRHANDRITIADTIDLQVIDSVSNAIIAIIELTPFISADGKAFLAPIDRETRFTSADGITIVVPAAAFDVPTMIRVEPAQRSAFDAVTAFDRDLRFSGAVRLEFDGIARRRIEIDMPAPANADASKSYFLGYLTDSAAGTRVELTDLVRLAGSRFTTIPASAAGTVRAQAMVVATSLADSDIRNHLGGARRSGIYAAVDMIGSTGWALLQGVKAGFDLINEHLQSIVTTVFTILENRGAALVPVPANTRFDIVGVDVTTGLEAFRKTYDPIAAGPPVNAVPLPSPIDDDMGPYPVFVSPARVEVVDTIKDVKVTSARELEVLVENGTLRIRNTATEKRRITAINTAATTSTTRELEPNVEADFGAASGGDRVVIAVEQKNVDPDAPVEVVFNRPIYINGDDADAYIHQQQLIRLRSGASDITDQVTFHLDSRGTRVELRLSGALQREKSFTVIVSNKISAQDPGPSQPLPGLTLLQRKTNGQAGDPLSTPISFHFSTRAPKGPVSKLTLGDGVVRDFALNGNVAIVSALDGGLQAFDVSDPAAFDRPPVGRLADTANEHWAVATDRHGRIFSTGVTPMLTFVQSYRLEDFLPATPSQQASVTSAHLAGSAMLTWRLGFSSTLPLSTTTTVFTDRPEALPRKLQLAVSDVEVRTTLEELAESGASSELPGGFRKINVEIPHDKVMPYQLQRITVENRTLKLRWSADAPRNGNAKINGIIGRATDSFAIVRNTLTYGVVSLFGFGVGVFDLNAIDSNDNKVEASYKPLQEQVVLANAMASPSDACTPDPNAVPCALRDLAFNPEAAIRPFGGDLMVYALEANRGLLDLRVTPPQEPDIPGRAAPSTGLALAASPSSNHAYHQRLRALRDAFVTASGGREPRARFTSISPYVTERDGRRVEYALIAARDFGVVVVRLGGGALGPESLVDVVWTPAGAYSVRVMPGSDVAVVVDGAGRVLLVDLKRIDESDYVDELPPCTATCPSADLFPTALGSIAANAAPGSGEVGADDPRILWKSAAGLVAGTLPPLVDPDTGFVFTGDVNDKTMRAVSAIDPRVRAVSDGEAVLHSILPLGIEAPKDAPASLGTFRLELVLPGAAAESLQTSALPFALESEAVPGAPTAQTIAPLPVAHLRSTGRRPTSFALRRLLPNVAGDADLARLRYQSGFNLFVSPYIVSIADPRASKDYEWGDASASEKKDDGCFTCTQPVLPHTPYELYTAGRFLRARPEGNVFAGTPYDYIGTPGRVELRLPTILADTVRPTRVLSAAQNPPMAGGALQAAVLLHSGEVVESEGDHDAGGRAGWNVVFDRTYRSRTLGATPLGFGWDSALFRRLRKLPNGDVEYRDGAEQWLFKKGVDGLTAPAGVYLTLHEVPAGGWSMRDLKNRIVTFDAYGRLMSEADVFFDGRGGGNIIRYLYDGNGRLSQIIDPMGRSSTLRYDDDGLLKTITDWRERAVDYHFTAGRLTQVELPKTRNETYLEFDHSSASTRPSKTYTYASESQGVFNALLETIQEPADNEARVTFKYDAKDMIVRETWGTFDHAVATYAFTLGARDIATQATVTDARQQVRRYTLNATPQPTDHHADRLHLKDVVEVAVPIWSGASFAKLPDAILPSMGTTTPVDRRTELAYHSDGRLATITRSIPAGVIAKTTFGYQAVGKGFVLQSRNVEPVGVDVPSFAQTFGREGAFLKDVTSDGEKVDAPEPRRGDEARKPKQSDGGVTVETVFNTDGLVGARHTMEPVAPATGEGETSTVRYYGADDPQKHRRGMPREVTAGDLVTTMNYGLDDEVVDAPRGVRTRTEYDELRRPVHITMTGPGAISPEEWLAYDASGRLVRHKRRQGGKLVESRFEYDVLGRRTRTSLYDGGQELEATSIEYQLPERLVRTHLPTGGAIITKTDALGRTEEHITDPKHPFATSITNITRYDADDNAVYTSDGLDAIATRYDVAHRPVETLRLDGTRATTKIDGWGRLREAKETSSGESFNADYTAGGRLREVSSNTSSTSFKWDAAGRTISTLLARGGTEPPLQSIAKFDDAGRLLRSASGESNGSEITKTFESAEYDWNGLDVPRRVTTTEDGHQSSYHLEHDMLGQAREITNATTSGFAMKRSFDEAGNVTSVASPERRGTTGYDYDARGLATDEHLPGAGAAKNHYDYKPGGVLDKYTDPAGEETKVTTDGLGRPVLRTYEDGTFEETHYAGARLLLYVDRQGRRQQFEYNEKGQLARIVGSTVLDQLTYEPVTGRLIGWKSGDTKIEYADFDAEGRPQTTRQIRYRGETILYQYTQTHGYNALGERIAWSMPQSSSMGTGWTTSVAEEHDAMGNVVAIRRNGTLLMRAGFRNAGRPKERRIFLGTDNTELLRQYSYDDATGIGRLNELKVFSRGALVAGSRVEFEGLQRTGAQLLGFANGARHTTWSYDDRGRVIGMLAASRLDDVVPLPGVAGAVNQDLTPADFRTQLLRTPVAPSESAPSATFTPHAAGGHKIATIEREGAPSEALRYHKADGSEGGSQRTEDARFRYEFDERGRLRSATEKLDPIPQSHIRRIVYSYNAMDRMVGRRIEDAVITNGQPPQESDWRLATADTTPFALPPAITLVWDPLSDQLVAIFEAETGRPLRQFLHGGMGLDDTIEVAAAAAPSGAVTRLYPIHDEAGAGSLQAVIREDGTLASRELMSDPHGEETTTISAPAVESITITGKKTESGQIASVVVSVHLTEPLDPATLSAGAILETITASGTTVRVATTAPTTPTPHTIEWTLTSADWTTLTTPPTATALAVSVSSTLRSTTFGPNTPTHPLTVREPLATIQNAFATTASTFTTTLPTPSLFTLGTPTQTEIGRAVVGGYQGLPFFESVTGLVYARARWYEPSTGTFLSPDPDGVHSESSNLYAFGGGDPINRRDPTGERSELSDDRREIQRRNAARDQAELAALGRGPGRISSAPEGNVVRGLFYFALDEATFFNAFSHEDANYNFLNPDQPTQASRDLRAFKKKFAKTILGIEVAEATVGGKAVFKALGLVGALYNYKDNSRPVTITIEYEEGWSERDFRRKSLALQDLGDRNKLFKAPNPVTRDPALTGAYKDRLIKAAYAKFGKSDPEKFKRLLALIRSMDVDHVHELQLLGADMDTNLGLLDSGVNQGIGRQIWRQIQKLDDYTPIKIIVKGMK